MFSLYLLSFFKNQQNSDIMIRSHRPNRFFNVPMSQWSFFLAHHWNSLGYSLKSVYELRDWVPMVWLGSIKSTLWSPTTAYCVLEITQTNVRVIF